MTVTFEDWYSDNIAESTVNSPSAEDSRPARLACIGQWTNKAQTMVIKERGDRLALELGQIEPLIVAPAVEADVWPMR